MQGRLITFLFKFSDNLLYRKYKRRRTKTNCIDYLCLAGAESLLNREARQHAYYNSSSKQKRRVCQTSKGRRRGAHLPYQGYEHVGGNTNVRHGQSDARPTVGYIQ